jgi:mRNA-degrading endonuclease RelE of RelBE toxin-antitoxin system
LIPSFAIGLTASCRPALRKIPDAWARRSARLKGFWRYKLGSYRVMCRIEDERFTVVVVAAGHRVHIYTYEER